MIPVAVTRVLDQLEAFDYEAYLVGGCVRDMLLDRAIHDYDVATNATPQQVKVIFPHAIPTGLKHGTVTIVTDEGPVEVTTYRVDLSYSDGRHPDSVQFTNQLEADLARRDFTINAMAMDLEGQVIDPFQGKSDLNLKRLRAVGAAEDRFHEDGLRILRALRFSAQLSFSIEQKTLQAMKSAFNQLKCVSNERIGQEWFRIAEGDWWSILDTLATGPFLDVMPQPLPDLKSGFQLLHHVRINHPDLPSQWESDMLALSKTWTEVPIRWLAATALWFTSANVSETASKQLARALAWRLDFAQDVSEVMRCMERLQHPLDEPDWRHLLYGKPPYTVELAVFIHERIDPSHSFDVRSKYMYARENQPLYDMSDLALTGHDLLALGYRGRQIGQLKQSLVEAVLDGDVPNEKCALLNYVRSFRSVQKFE